MHDKNNYVMLHLFTQNKTKMKADKRYQYALRSHSDITSPRHFSHFLKRNLFFVHLRPTKSTQQS